MAEQYYANEELVQINKCAGKVANKVRRLNKIQ